MRLEEKLANALAGCLLVLIAGGTIGILVGSIFVGYLIWKMATGS